MSTHENYLRMGDRLERHVAQHLLSPCYIQRRPLQDSPQIHILNISINIHLHSMQTRSLLRRPKRPYTFTQLIALSDGSTFVHRTTSPTPVYRSTRDTRNSLLWNPTSKKLLTVEDDEAGRLAAFRAKFGRSFDAVGTAAEEAAAAAGGAPKPTGQNIEMKQAQDAAADAAAEKAIAQEEAELQEEEDSLLDLISSFGQEENGKKK
uniref:54S ribosomal protein L36, mitochondrial n=1 Tax=Talaromyces marneffei PM1 TaxID=1077442 RepID=A0A093V8A7_TALMA